MKRNEEILNLAEEIMLDITNSRIPLHSVLLKASRLSLLLDIPKNVTLFKEWAKFAEQNSFVIETYKSTIEATKDHDVSIASANPEQYVFNPIGNTFERTGIRNEAKQVVGYLANSRTETYNFTLGIYTKWRFGSVAEGIFEKKRNRAEPILREIFPDANQRLNAIEQNILSDNPEHWKNAVTSCRTLFMDVADVLNPAITAEQKEKYINRLKDYISPRLESDTKKDFLVSLLEEMKNRLEFTIQATQGGAHRNRPILIDAENVVLYTYLIIADLMEIHASAKKSGE